MASDQSNHAQRRSGEDSAREATSGLSKRLDARKRARFLLAGLRQQMPAAIPEGQGRHRLDRVWPAATLINTPRPGDEETAQAAS